MCAGIFQGSVYPLRPPQEKNIGGRESRAFTEATAIMRNSYATSCLLAMAMTCRPNIVSFSGFVFRPFFILCICLASPVLVPVRWIFLTINSRHSPRILSSASFRGQAPESASSWRVTSPRMDLCSVFPQSAGLPLL